MLPNGITSLKRRRLPSARGLTSTIATRRGLAALRGTTITCRRASKQQRLLPSRGLTTHTGTTTRLTPAAISKLTRSHTITLVVTATIAYMLVVLKYHPPILLATDTIGQKATLRSQPCCLLLTATSSPQPLDCCLHPHHRRACNLTVTPMAIVVAADTHGQDTNSPRHQRPFHLLL